MCVCARGCASVCRSVSVCVCQLISPARRLSRAKIFLPFAGNIVNFTRQLQFCLRCPAFPILIHIHVPVLALVRQDGFHTRILMLTIRGTFNWLNWSRVVLPGIASMLLLLLPRLVSHFPVVQQMSSCPSLLRPLPQSLLSVCPLYTLSTFMQQLFNLICHGPLPFVLASPAHLSLHLHLRLRSSLHLNGCQMCRPWAGVRVYTCSAVCVCVCDCVSPQRERPQRHPNRKWI